MPPRGLAGGRRATDEQASRAVGRIARLGIDTVLVDDLLPRMWQLKANISAYDAAYVALAERRGLTLVTADARLDRTTTAYCRVELVA